MTIGRPRLAAMLTAGFCASVSIPSLAASGWMEVSAPVFQATDLNASDGQDAGFRFVQAQSGAGVYAWLDGLPLGRSEDILHVPGWLGPVSASVGDARGHALASQDPVRGVRVEASATAPRTSAIAVSDTYYPQTPFEFGLNVELAPYTSLQISAHYAAHVALDGLGCQASDCESAGYEFSFSGDINLPDRGQVQFFRLGGVHASVPGAVSLSPEGDALLTLVNDSASPRLTSVRLWAEVTAYAPQLAAPIPEPQTWALMLAGLALLGFLPRRSARLSNGRQTCPRGVRFVPSSWA
jgi:hypothetical protein